MEYDGGTPYPFCFVRIGYGDDLDWDTLYCYPIDSGNNSSGDCMKNITPSEKKRYDETVNRIPESASDILHIGCARHNEKRRNRANLHDYIIDHTDAEVHGIDILESEIITMQKEGYNVSVGDAEKLDINSTYDVIVAGEVIEHLANPGMFLDSVQSVMTDESIVILTTPNPDGFYYWRKTLTGDMNNETHTCWIDPYNLKQLVSITDGIRVKEIEYLEPMDKIGKMIWKLGNKRGSADTYISTLKKVV